MKTINPYSLKRLVTGGLCLFAFCCFAHQAQAQCDNITISIVATAATCQSDGRLTVTVTGTDVGNLDITTAQYAIDPVSGTTYSQPWANPATRTATGGILTGIPPGTYTVRMRAFCSVNQDYVVRSAGNQATVGGNYTVPNAYITNTSIRKTFDTNTCANTLYAGQIPIVLSGGRTPYTITMTSKPATYTGPTTFTVSSASTYSVNNLPAGNYAFTVMDACTYSISLTTVTVGTFTANFTADMVYNYPYMPSTYTEDCNKIRLNVRYLSSSHELYHVYNQDYYEVGFTYNSTAQPTTWQPLPSSYMDYTLPVDRDVFRANNQYVAVWVKIKGTNCAYKVRDVIAYSTTYIPLSYTSVNCDTVQVNHYLYGASIYNHFCYPYRWCVVKPAAPYDTIIPWSAPVTHTGSITTRMPYGSQIVYRDAKGNEFKTTIQTATINNISGTYSNFFSYPYVNASTGYYPSFPVLYVNDGFPIGTRVQYLSGPSGTPAPKFADITTTVNTNYIYPYSSSTSTTGYTSMPMTAPYIYLTPGEYKFRVTLPNNCGTKDITCSPYFYQLTTPLSLSNTQETCDGLQIYPTGGPIRYTYNGTTWNTYATTWYSIETAPSGVTVDRTGVQAGGFLLLPASGTYVIKLTTSQSTNTTNYTGYDTIRIAYEKKALALDVGVTSAYVCAEAEGGTGSIRVKGANGSGNYTYQLRTQGGGTLIQQNTTGTFSYGSAGQTYTIRVIDNECNKQFDQDVTILDLSDAQITYSSGSMSNVFCEGQTLRVNCITLGTTSYNWTGPGGWTSTEQNPTRPNATPAMSGRYTVTVTPEGCGEPMTQYIDIVVSPCVAAVNPHLKTRVQ
jgi:hypothetical protein